MRIEAYTQIQQLYNSNNTVKLKKDLNRTGFSDQLQISDLGKDIHIAKNAVKNSPDVREDVTADIKKRMDAGTYYVDSDSFAERLFEKYNSALF